MTDNFVYRFVIIFVMLVISEADFNPFSDSILHTINWPGPIQQELSDPITDSNSIDLVTNNNEKYRCVLPDQDADKNRGEEETYAGPTELELLKPLFEQTTCSYRIESYWTYELCHGKFLRQYHEEKEMTKSKPSIQEYYLGKAVPEKDSGESTETQVPAPPTSETGRKARVPLQKVEGIEIPYFAVNMSDGTVCDLTKRPRQASLHYVCQPEGKGEIYELKEVSSCEYEVVVLTRLLCQHPAYKQKKETASMIQCHALDGAPKRPKSLDNLELQNSMGRFNKKHRSKASVKGFVDAMKKSSTLPKKDRTIEHHVTVKEETKPPTTVIGSNTDKQLLRDFLKGEYCLTGGSGWWKHEFCYGRSVSQFHQEKDGSRTTIMLGVWDQDDHVAYIDKHPAKKPKSVDTRRHVIHYYGTGDVCELTNRRRFSEVKLKCKENPNQPHAIALYLVEPETCEYLLVVESPIFCPLIQQADNYGLLQDPDLD